NLLAIRAVRQSPQVRVGGLIDLHAASVTESHRRIWKVCIRQNSKNVRWRPGKWTKIGEKLLFRITQRMGRAADDVFQVEVINLESRLSRQKFLNHRLARLQNLRLDVGGLSSEIRCELHHLLLHPLMLRVARILIGKQTRINVESSKVF